VECQWHGLEAGDVEVGAPPVPRGFGLHWMEQAKHWILLMRLQRPYLLYCLTCSLLGATAFLSTMVDLIREHDAGRRWEDILEGGSWQSACWTAVAFALCAEVAGACVVRQGSLRCALKQDWWFAFDATVVLLTILAWVLMHLRRASPLREEAEEADLWLLTLRFALQPCRVLAAAKMAHKVQLMQQSHTDVNFDVLADVCIGPQEIAAGGSPFQRTAV